MTEGSLDTPARRAPSSQAVCDQCSTTLILSAEWVYLGQRLAIFAVQKLAHRLSLSLVRFTHRFAFLCVHAALSMGAVPSVSGRAHTENIVSAGDRWRPS